MSFNNNDKKTPAIITRSNCEEYFLLYVDDELTADEKKAVEAFVLLHPDLKDELDVLLGTKLTADPIALHDKQFLLADEMKAAGLTEQLLFYIDDELTKEEKKKVEAELANSPAAQKQYNLLQKTKADKSELIPYPDKIELYRHTGKRAALPVYWLRIAAAVLILLFAGLFFWMAQNNSKEIQPVAVRPAPQQKTVLPLFEKNDSVAAPQLSETYIAVQDKKEKEEPVAEVSHIFNKVKQQRKAAPVVQKPVFADIADAAMSPIKEPVVKQKDAAINNPAPKETIDIALNKLPVTSTTPHTYTTTEAAAVNPQPDFAAAKEEKKGGTLKTILRKATRFIERRTGISATNEDDELLIGAVAIQL